MHWQSIMPKERLGGGNSEGSFVALQYTHLYIKSMRCKVCTKIDGRVSIKYFNVL